MNECGLGLSDGPLVGELSQEGRGTGDRGAIFYNLYNWSFDMSDLTVCVSVHSQWRLTLLPYCLLALFQVITPIRAEITVIRKGKQKKSTNTHTIS